jgi:hypothetical protein
LRSLPKLIQANLDLLAWQEWDIVDKSQVRGLSVFRKCSGHRQRGELRIDAIPADMNAEDGASSGTHASEEHSIDEN